MRDKLLRDAAELAAMSHDWGKVDVFDPDGGKSGKSFFSRHEKMSAERLTEMQAPELVINLVREHGTIRQVDQMSDKGIRKIVKRLVPDGFEDCKVSCFLTLLLFDMLLLCDSAAFSPFGMEGSRLQWREWKERLYDLEVPGGGMTHRDVLMNLHWALKRDRKMEDIEL